MLSGLLSTVAANMRAGGFRVDLVLGDAEHVIPVSSEGELRAQLAAAARAGWELVAVHEHSEPLEDGPMATLEFSHPTV